MSQKCQKLKCLLRGTAAPLPPSDRYSAPALTFTHGGL